MAFALATPLSVAYADADPLAAAQAHLTQAIRNANEAAAAYDAAQNNYYRLLDQNASAREQVAQLQVQNRQLGRLARIRAVEVYTSSSLPLDSLFGSDSNVLDDARRATLLDRVDAKGNEAIAQLAVVSDELHVQQGALNKQLSQAKASLDLLHAREVAEEAAVNDARHAEQLLRDRLAAEQRLAEFRTMVARAQAQAQVPVVSSAPAPSSGGSAGQIIGSGSWVCPVQGPHSFTDTFGAPRGNGRTHKGNDIFAPLGTPIVAVVSGSVFFQGDPDGGNAAYVSGGGTTYYYAHLNDYVGGARNVSAGELIGHVGNTGDAAGGPTHLHFEIRPGGPNGAAIDPYPTLAAHC
jgi:murein DD-endopeptidase MepM/ murein hydrolase activator NlpD